MDFPRLHDLTWAEHMSLAFNPAGKERCFCLLPIRSLVRAPAGAELDARSPQLLSAARIPLTFARLSRVIHLEGAFGHADEDLRHAVS